MTVKKNALKIFIIPGIIPFPPNSGGSICIFGLIDYLRKFHSIHVLLLAFTPKDKENILALTREWPDVTIDYVVNYEEDDSSNYRRDAAKIVKKGVRALYHSIKKNRAANGNQGIDLHKWYTNYFNMSFYPLPEPFIKKIAGIIAENEFHIIQTELTTTLNLVNLFPANAKKVFVQIEGRSDVLYDYGVSNNFAPDYIKYIAGNADFLEYGYMQQYDAILALNETDRLKIIEKVPAKVKVYSSPYGILDKEIKALGDDDYKAENLIFMGAEGHYPNADGLHWFLTDIVAKFEQKPFKKLYVTGYWQESTMKRCRELLDCIDFIGFVDDLGPYLKNSVCIVPIRIGGGGIRTKILVAMSQGSPVVATTLSAVGINGADQKELLIADTAEQFAESINHFFRDDKFAQALRQRAYQLILDEYSQSAVGKIRSDIYHEICLPE